MAEGRHGLVLVTKAGRAARRGRPPGRKAADKLAKAAIKEVDMNSDELANSLLNAALKGDASSAKLLLSLAESEFESGECELNQGGGSVAQQLATEEQWSGDEDNFRSETGFGGREPEG